MTINVDKAMSIRNISKAVDPALSRKNLNILNYYESVCFTANAAYALPYERARMQSIGIAVDQNTTGQLKGNPGSIEKGTTLTAPDMTEDYSDDWISRVLATKNITK
jgi:hypothetical protein